MEINKEFTWTVGRHLMKGKEPFLLLNPNSCPFILNTKSQEIEFKRIVELAEIEELYNQGRKFVVCDFKNDRQVQLELNELKEILKELLEEI